MGYIDQSDLLDELGEDTLIQLTDDSGTGEINTARVLKAIESAQGTFDSYARSRYSIPVAATPMVKSLNTDLAVFHLYKSRTAIADGVYIVKENAFKAAMQTLKDIGSGKAALDVPTADETATNPDTPDRILTNAASAKFTDANLSSF